MHLSTSKLAEIKSKTISKIMKELDLAASDNKIDEFLKKYEIIIEEETMPVQPRTMKILVMGDLAGKLKDYQMIAKKLNIPKNNLEFISDYKELKRFSVSKLEYSNVYSDIIYGPNPHKQVDMGKYSSFLVRMKKESHKYPRVHTSIANEKLKITISNFKETLLSTRYYEAI
jgi:hypothetical protein